MKKEMQYCCIIAWTGFEMPQSARRRTAAQRGNRLVPGGRGFRISDARLAQGGASVCLPGRADARPSRASRATCIRVAYPLVTNRLPKRVIPVSAKTLTRRTRSVADEAVRAPGMLLRRLQDTHRVHDTPRLHT